MSYPACMCRVAMTTALLGVPTAGVAQGNSHARQGAWFSGGAAFVTAWQTAPYSGRHNLSGGSLRLGAGWGMNPMVQVGVGLTAPVTYDATSQDEEINVAPALIALLRMYPSAAAGLVLSGGLGLGAVRTLDEPRLAFEGSVAYDLSLRRHVSLSPYASVLRIGDRYRPTTYAQLGLAITLD